MTRPLLLGHRGARACRDIPENTLASFELCLQQGCHGFEFDVRLAGDGQAVVCHDASVGRVTISRTASSQLPLPMPEAVLEQFGARAFLDIELKVAGLEALLLGELRRYPPQKGYVVSSFLAEVLRTIHDLDPAIPLGVLCETHRQLRGWREMGVEWVVPQDGLVDRELVDQVHEAGKKIMIWTVNRDDRIREVAEWGVDAIISDDTELLVRTMRSVHPVIP
jgi:glycerophosphoryl diester phosphodiesterase